MASERAMENVAESRERTMAAAKLMTIVTTVDAARVAIEHGLNDQAIEMVEPLIEQAYETDSTRTDIIIEIRSVIITAHRAEGRIAEERDQIEEILRMIDRNDTRHAEYKLRLDVLSP